MAECCRLLLDIKLLFGLQNHYEGTNVDGAMGSLETTRLKDIINMWIIQEARDVRLCLASGLMTLDV